MIRPITISMLLLAVGAEPPAPLPRPHPQWAAPHAARRSAQPQPAFITFHKVPKWCAIQT